MNGRDKFQLVKAALLRGLNFGRRGSVALPIATILFFAVGAMAQTTNVLSDAEIQGRKLAQQLCEARPAENFTNTGVLKIRDSKGGQTNLSVKCEIIITATNWENNYIAFLKFGPNGIWVCTETFTVVHDGSSVNRYLRQFYCNPDQATGLFPVEKNMPFVNSDFWAEDLGLEFFHWPEQKILKHEMRRGRACKVLESVDPSPATNGYSRVVSWIDNESGGIVQAEAYDFKNKLLKEFAPKSFKKVNGQWQLQEMEIRSVQTGSRTRLEFDLEKE